MKIENNHIIVNEPTNMCLCGDYGGVALHCAHVLVFVKENVTLTEIEMPITWEQIDKAIDVALTAPAPQIAIHHLIDRVIEKLGEEIK